MKKIGLVACVIATIPALGLGGTASASGGVLCEVNESPCSPESIIEEGTVFGWLMQLNPGSQTCIGSVSGKFTADGGEVEPVEAEVTGFGAACNVPQLCEYKAENLPYDMELAGSGGNGTMVLSGPSTIKIKRTCFFPSSTCTFSPAGDIGFEFSGGEPAVMTATEVPIIGTPAGCATSMTVRVESKAANPQGLFLV